MLARATLAAFAVLVASTPALAAEKKLDRTFTVAEGGRLTIDAEGSDVTVSGTNGAQVVVHAIVKGSERQIERTTIDAQQSGNDVTVTLKSDRSNWLDWFQINGGQSKINVEVPRSYHVEIDTSGGDLTIRQLKGEARGRTSGGDVRVTEVTGPVYMRTSGGDVVLESIEGETDVKTSGGDIDAKRVTGSLSARTSGGHVHLDGIDGAVDAHTSGGDIRVELSGANRGLSATTSGGDIVLRLSKNVSATIDASTSGGSIRTELPVTTSELSARKLRGTINGGGERIHARTLGGDIRLLTAGEN